MCTGAPTTVSPAIADAVTEISACRPKEKSAAFVSVFFDNRGMLPEEPELQDPLRVYAISLDAPQAISPQQHRPGPELFPQEL